MHNLTLEEMMANAEGFQDQKHEAEEMLKSSPRGSREWRMAFKKKKDAEAMLEEYLGYTKKSGKFIPDGNVDERGFATGTWTEVTFVKGAIQRKVEEAEHLKEDAHLGKRFEGRTFASFDAKRDREAFDVCSKYANDPNLMSRKRNGLLLGGGFGSGKTHLAAAISNVLISRGIPVLFGTSKSHLDNLRDEIEHTEQKTYLSKMKVTPMLVIDDLGKEKKSEWTKQVWFDVVNYRYEHMLPIVITTNLVRGENASALANHVEGAVFSRLCEMCNIVETKGLDYRQEVT